MSQTKTKPQTKRRTPKANFITNQIAKGRTEKQATAMWKLSRMTATMKRREKNRKKWRAVNNGHSYKMRRDAAALGLRESCELRLAAAEAAIQKHFRLLGLPKQKIEWLGSPADAPRNGISVKWRKAEKAERAIIRSRRPRGLHIELESEIWELSGIRQLCEEENRQGRGMFTDFQNRRRRWRHRRRGSVNRRRSREFARIAPSDPVVALADVQPGALQPLLRAAEAGLWAFWPLARNKVVALARPRIRLEPTGSSWGATHRLHCAEGPAIIWPDGSKFFVWHGIPASEAVILHPDKITTADIEEQSNAELRRVLMERYGPERYMRETGAFEMHRDEFGILWGKAQFNTEALLMVQVVNSTPEPDATRKNYWLRVPPDMTTAKEAVAWTFRMDADEYQPAVET